MKGENLNTPKFSKREFEIIIAELSSLLIGGELEEATEEDEWKTCAVRDIKAGQDIFLYGIEPIGVAARDIPAGSIINYKPNENTADVIVIEERKNANTP
jgi:hypothetical protein